MTRRGVLNGLSAAATTTFASATARKASVFQEFQRKIRHVVEQAGFVQA
jgi:hypothetical protein